MHQIQNANISKFDKIIDFWGVWATPKRKNFSKKFYASYFFMKWHNLKGCDLKISSCKGSRKFSNFEVSRNLFPKSEQFLTIFNLNDVIRQFVM